jgi:capsular exopolysaccharide synthesis family protein
LSKNYELLQRASVEGNGRPVHVPAPLRAGRTYEMRPVPDAHVLSREELVKLVQAVFLLPGEKSPKVVIFTGAESATGCSSICVGAAQALAASVDERVCLVDSNLRYPSLHLCLGMENTKGLGEALANPEPIQAYIKKVPGDELWFLTSGLISSPRAWTMNSSRLRARIGELRQEFRFILMDSPPVNVYSDAISLGQLADGVVLIVSANSTRKEAGRKAKESLEMAGSRLLGAVLNNRTYPIPQPIYDRL